MKKNELTQEIVKELLRYEPETGKLFWRERDVKWFKDGKRSSQGNANNWNTKNANKEAFASVCSHGYKYGHIFTSKYKAHRIIWLIEHGQFPIEQIDHIDGNRSNNCIENLRCVTNQENARNTKKYSNNTSSVTGVCWHKSNKKWWARIYDFNGRQTNLGFFDNLDDAIAARKTAEKEYGYHENHGREK